MTMHANTLPENKKKHRKRKVKCHACSEPATVVCDMKDCGRACCNLHGRWWRSTLHLCLGHAKEEGLG